MTRKNIRHCVTAHFSTVAMVFAPPPPRLPLLWLLILEAIATATGVINLIICSYSLQHNSPICPACIIHAAGIGLEIRIRTRITSTIDSQRGNYFPGNTTDIFMYICNINIQPLKKKNDCTYPDMLLSRRKKELIHICGCYLRYKIYVPVSGAD